MSSPITLLLPHRPPMLWIDALSECTDTTARATACFTAAHFAAADGTVLETALVECVAQAVAAARVERARRTGLAAQDSQGTLAAVSSFCFESRPVLGKCLEIEVRELKRFGALLLVQGKVWCEGQVIASGELTLHD